MRFQAELESHGRTATGVEVPEGIVDALGAGRRPPVRATINGYTWRTSVASMGGRFLLGVNAEARAGAGVSAGDLLEVDVEHDPDPRTMAVPEDLAAALADSSDARARFEELSYSHQRRYIEAVQAAKKPETRANRVTWTVETLRAESAERAQRS